jgi:WD40 repeat protein/tRNA A-37 threonylcarbamoyl transferase component Bud32
MHSIIRDRRRAVPKRKDGQTSRDEMTDQHPTTEQLRAFATGQVDDARGAAIEGHLTACESCWSVIEEADDASPVARVLRSIPAERLRSLVERAANGAAEKCRPVAPQPPAELLDHPRYRLLGFIGSGGMGHVWKARHELMNRVVAVKVIRPDLLRDEKAVARFRQEVEAAAALDHAGIVRAFDAERVGDLHFLVMEYVEGVDLARLVQEQGPLPVAEACDYARQVAAGLAYAHERGLVHRDIKPHNLLRTPEGRVKVSDFGLASFLADHDEAATDRPPQAALSTSTSGSVTRLGDGCGTPDYIAPEQIRDARSVDGRADIYSLGCTLYHLLAGQPPFAGGSGYSKVAGHLERQPTPVVEFRDDLPPALAGLVARMMAKDAAERLKSAAEVAEALTPFTTPAATMPTVKRPTRRRWLLATAGLGLGVLGGLLAARRWLLPGVPLAAEVRCFRGHSGSVQSVAISPDGKFVLSGGDDRTMRLWSVETGEELRRFDGHEGWVSAVAFSPDGSQAASGNYDRIVRLWDLRTGRELHRLSDNRQAVVRLTFSPDGSRLLSAGEDRSVILWDAAAGRLLQRLEGHAGPVQAVAFSPDGRYALSSGNDRTVRVWNLEEGREVRCLQGHRHVVDDVAISPDGRLALSVSQDRMAKAWDWQAGEEVRSVNFPDRVYRVAFPPGGPWAVCVRDDGTASVWDVDRHEELCRLIGHRDKIWDAAAALDGKYVVTAGVDGTVRLWQVPQGYA